VGPGGVGTGIIGPANVGPGGVGTGIIGPANVGPGGVGTGIIGPAASALCAEVRKEVTTTVQTIILLNFMGPKAPINETLYEKSNPYVAGLIQQR
jgi:hypothetical protein